MVDDKPKTANELEVKLDITTVCMLSWLEIILNESSISSMNYKIPKWKYFSLPNKLWSNCNDTQS